MRHAPILLAALLALPQGATAQSLTPAEAEVVPRILDHLCHELRDDWIGCEEITLLADDDAGAADLIIRPNQNADTDAPPILRRTIAFNGGMFGQRPALVAGPEGSFRLTSEQTGIGRSPWEMSVSIAWRDGTFVIAGVTYTTWDRFSAQSFTCDLNLRTGGYEIVANDARTAGKGRPVRILLQDWSADSPLPDPCEDDLAAWWPE